MATARTAPRTPPSPPPTESIEEVSTAIEKAVSDCGVRAIAKLPKMHQALKLAEGIAALKGSLTDDFMRETIMPLMGSALGFLADRPNDKQGPYGIEVVRECLIEALIRGFNPVGNEFNIIAGRFYGTKNGFERLVIEHPGMTNLVLQPGVPKMQDGGALVTFTASWTVQGVPMRIDCLPPTQQGAPDMRIPVRVNNNMGVDAIIGKATRKMYFRIYQRINGSAFGLVDGEVTDADPILTTGTAAPTPLRAKDGKSSGAALDALAAAHKARKSEPPANDTPLPAPDVIYRELVAADEAWAALDEKAATTLVASWWPADQRATLAWARANNDPAVNDAEIPTRPPCSMLGRQPGED